MWNKRVCRTLGCNNDRKVSLILFRACIRRQRLCTPWEILSLHWSSTTEATNCDQSRSSDWVYRKLRKLSTTLWEVSTLWRIVRHLSELQQSDETHLQLYYPVKKPKKKQFVFLKHNACSNICKDAQSVGLKHRNLQLLIIIILSDGPF